MACDQCCGPGDLSAVRPGYRRALAIVVALNLAMGLVEIGGGFLARSQALKADSLDFLGDGLITLLAFAALSRGPAWRSRAALLQGCFLAALGAGVLVASIYRAFVHTSPDPQAMGLLGVLGLAANLGSAAILIPHRAGDTHARAVWLFSRNDALANLAVISAGALVAWTGTLWPDLIAAAAIAALFEISAFEIIRNARADLRTRAARPSSPARPTFRGEPGRPAET